jgi:hypothetical protein
MHANDFIINNGAAWQRIKCIAKVFPHLDRKPAATLIIKSVDSINTSAFMISSEKKKVFRIFDLISEQKTYNF